MIELNGPISVFLKISPTSVIMLLLLLLTPLLFFQPPVSSVPSSLPSCTTIAGPADNKPCVFPFTINGVIYNKCFTDGKVKTACSTRLLFGIKIKTCIKEGLSEPWCSTATNADGSHVAGKGNFGACPSDCENGENEQGGEENQSGGEQSSCSTVSGPASGSLCVFPFTLVDQTFTECTEWKFGGENQGKLWCSTK